MIVIAVKDLGCTVEEFPKSPFERDALNVDFFILDVTCPDEGETV